MTNNKKRLENPKKRKAYLAYQKAYRAPGATGHEKRLARQKQAMEIVLAAKDKPCMDCGKRFHPACMEFDHRDPAKKFKDVSALATCTYKIERIHKEIAKCDLVCACCHRLRTVKRGGYPNWYPPI